MSNKPHKHAGLIKAWADGAEIQYFSPVYREWCEARPHPIWEENVEYRIKPKVLGVREAALSLRNEVIALSGLFVSDASLHMARGQMASHTREVIALLRKAIDEAEAVFADHGV